MKVQVVNELSAAQKKVFGWCTERFFAPLAQRAAKLEKLPHTDMAVILVNAQKMRSLNKKFRGKDKTTDVLSFAEGESLVKEKKKSLGDVVICLSEAKKNARTYKRPVEKEVALLFVHGLLHTAGYDHATTADRAHMFERQDSILGEHIDYE
jgi:probable rRNA maturation factor